MQYWEDKKYLKLVHHLNGFKKIEDKEKLKDLISKIDGSQQYSLLPNGKDISSSGGVMGWWRLIDAACYFSDEFVVRECIGIGHDVNALDSNALVTACRYSSLDIIKFLIDSGAHDVRKQSHGCLAASCYRNNATIVKFLVEKGFVGRPANDKPGSGLDLGERFQYLSQCLRTAIKKGNEEIVSILLEYNIESPSFEHILFMFSTQSDQSFTKGMFNILSCELEPFSDDQLKDLYFSSLHYSLDINAELIARYPRMKEIEYYGRNLIYCGI